MGHATPPAEPAESLHQRLLAAVGTRSYRHIGELTHTHPETVRRYLHGQSPGVDFIAQLATALELSSEWLLTGHGPMKVQDLKAHALASADTSELLQAMSNTIARLIDRVERVETYVQTLETRVRAQQPPESHIEPKSTSRTSTDLLSSPPVGQTLAPHTVVVDVHQAPRPTIPRETRQFGTANRTEPRSPGGGT